MTVNRKDGWKQARWNGGRYRTYIDLMNGRRARFNTVGVYMGLCVPAWISQHSCNHSHPSRVPEKLLRELNTDVKYQAALDAELARRVSVLLAGESARAAVITETILAIIG